VTSDPHPTVRMDEAVIDGRYRLERLVGTGGVASVFEATDLLLDRRVAVKLLKEATDCAEDRARFELETRTLARLTHPGLVTMLDAGAFLGRPYLVMELVDGPPLSAVLGVPLDLGRAAEIGTQVAAALACAHRQGVVHRDVKPGNVLLRSDGRVKLADFGIARLVGERSEATRTGVVVGSVHYLAPEQVAFEEITPAVDVYALGLLLIRAITGQHAFDGPTIETALARLTTDPAVPDHLPSGWRDLLTAMTVRDPARRPTATEVAERLSRLGTATATATVLPPYPLSAATPEPTVARRLLGAARDGGVAARIRRISPVAVAVTALALVLYVTAALAGDPDEVAGPAATAAADERPPRSTTAAEATDGPALPQPVATDRAPAPQTQPVATGPAPKVEKAKNKKTKGKKTEGKAKGKGKGKGKGGKGRR
jgi:tRNA A-37 threonylcarbamoyl transferase component Bud32